MWADDSWFSTELVLTELSCQHLIKFEPAKWDSFCGCFFWCRFKQHLLADTCYCSHIASLAGFTQLSMPVQWSRSGNWFGWETIFWPWWVPNQVYHVRACLLPSKEKLSQLEGVVGEGGGWISFSGTLVWRNICQTMAGVYTSSMFYIVKPWWFWSGTETPTTGLNILSYHGLSS